MKKMFILPAALLLAALVFLSVKSLPDRKESPADDTAETGVNPPDIPDNLAVPQKQNGTPAGKNTASLQSPLDRAAERVTKKTFGLYITPETSPVQPDKFRGYHTGTDFEIFPNEENIDVPVHAICDGKLTVKKTASGYGGVAAQNCEIDGKSTSVVYGHLKLASISKKVGDNFKAGEVIGILGKGFSPETDGERKHLHLGIHKETSVNILGYVQSKAELSGWLDACPLVCK